MDVQAVKNELPDDPAELLRLHEDLGGFGSNYCIARIDDGKVTAMTLMALIKVTTNITPIQHELIPARQELSRMAPKNTMLIRGISDATTIPATAEELAQLRASLPAPPKADLGDTVDGFLMSDF